ncbi:MAG: ATPase, T2SS/T4P/T4SS family [Bacteroidota bacterium]
MPHTDIFTHTLRTLLRPIQPFLEDETVNEVLVNGPGEIYIERRGVLELTEARFPDGERLMAACRNIAQFSGTALAEDTLRVDARLPDGSRVHMMFPPLAKKGICVAIRKFSTDRLGIRALVEGGALSRQALGYLHWCILTKKNILVSGGTSSGKTTLLNALSELIPTQERIITIEDTFELQLQQPHVVPLETRMNVESWQKPVTLRDLFTSSLRMRPDRIIIGELRGPEALDFLQAMISGHGGSLSTIHADTPEDALERLATLVALSKVEIPPAAVRAQIRSAIHVVVQMARDFRGRRAVTGVAEVERGGGREKEIGLQMLFQLRTTGADPLSTSLEWTGKRSLFPAEFGGLPADVDWAPLREILPP